MIYETSNEWIWDRLLMAKESISIYNLGQIRLNIFSGFVPNMLSALLKMGVEVELFTRLPKSGVFSEKISELGLTKLKVWHVDSDELPARFISVIDKRKYVCDVIFSEQLKEKLGARFPFKSSDELENVARNIFKEGDSIERISVFEAYFNAARESV